MDSCKTADALSKNALAPLGIIKYGTTEVIQITDPDTGFLIPRDRGYFRSKPLHPVTVPGVRVLIDLELVQHFANSGN